MVDPRLYEQDNFVFLDSGKPEELISAKELIARLAQLVGAYPDNLPIDVASVDTPEQQVQYLIDNYCELRLDANQLIQWFAVRLEKE